VSDVNKIINEKKEEQKSVSSEWSQITGKRFRNIMTLEKKCE
jgi:hypothetical protein